MCKPPPPRSAACATAASQKIEPVQIDPVVCALHTVMYGLLFHVGTIWSIENFIRAHQISNEVSGAITSPSSPCTIPFVLLLHEYWVYLQHNNVLVNPHLQHLDRQYGIALLRNNHHWAIAGTLASYWCRESVGMFLTLPYLHQMHLVKYSEGIDKDDASYSFSKTQYLILYSLIYHTVKSRGVRSDAMRRYSSDFGIMRLVIDRFYLDSLREFGVTSLRLFLQGFDTYIHFRIVRDLMILLIQPEWVSSSSGDFLLSSSQIVSSIHLLFVVWVVHAALNQLLRCSTATAIVHCWHFLTKNSSGNACARSSSISGTSEDANKPQPTKRHDKKNDQRDIVSSRRSESLPPECIASSKINTTRGNDEKYIVRQLLDRERVPKDLRGRLSSANAYVDKAVRIETAIVILAIFFMIGLGEVPLRILSDQSSALGFGEYVFMKLSLLRQDRGQLCPTVLFSWLFWGILHGIGAFLLKTSSPSRGNNSLRYGNRRQSLVNAIDMAIMIAIGTHSLTPKAGVWLVCALITMKSYLQTKRNDTPRLFRISTLGLELLAKFSLLRSSIRSSSFENPSLLLSSILSLLWLMWVVCNPIPTPCEEIRKKHIAADAVFLGHPAELSDSWALWLLPYSLKERWRPPFWAVLLWPFHYIVGIYVCSYRRRFFGDEASYFCCDDVRYGNTRIQNWVSAHFARHFVTHPHQVKENIEAAARHAESIGVKVLCLGALNKAESINGGGVGIVKALGPNRKLSVIHGNHLTAAAVVAQIKQIFPNKSARFFLTGASSKVGWAVAQALKDYGYQVLCHSSDRARRQLFEKHGFASASTLLEGSGFSDCWIVGKYDRAVAREIPQNAIAVVFSVPHPLSSRNDVHVIEAGTLHMDLDLLDRPRLFVNKLEAHEIFACHAASVVAHNRLKTGNFERIDEVGPVDINEMNSWLRDAERLGFRVPQPEPVQYHAHSQYQGSPVIIVGAGPAGLCVAAGLSRKMIPHVVLDEETNTDVFGSWNVLSRIGANITTQKRWCSLPGYAMSDEDFPGEFISPDEYQRYLKQYAHRFSIDIHRGARVISVGKGTEPSPWIVKVKESGNEKVKECSAPSVIIATGKHRKPHANIGDDVVSKLEAYKIPFAHSTEMNSDNWKLAFQAAKKGALCIVGFGNSAADLITIVLQNCGDKHKESTTPMIHIAARTIPPVFPQCKSFLRVDSLGYIVRQMPAFLQEFIVKLLWRAIPSSRQCDYAFPSYLKRWKKINGRIPVIDKGFLASGFQSGHLKGHGPIFDVTKSGVLFNDHKHTLDSPPVKVEMIILATGYKEECIVDREDRPNGLFRLGVGNDFLPIRSISEEAELIVEEIAKYYKNV
ncbi:hypothetical protein HJC23_012278 [Cyclotella cryptica]|uniref:Flavin-containing monooxygenase n=1 Tax=Cyclotella cryptica TaxID=29204 RepID=A0ABD3P728_9STRA|eukprot:CCRYP_016800-RA/>CCRYP_016800-RA protein AED:0.01 eAED:0.01 QI:130/1/1/1/1/1/2/446/1346